MSGVNKVILIGNLGKDPEVRSIENGAKVASFSLATNEVFKGKDGNKVEQTEWHNIVVWRGLAELAEKYLKKGSQIYLEGRIKTRSWDDKEGNKRYITEIVGDTMNFLGKPGGGGGDSYQAPHPSEEPVGASTAEEDGDLPF
jgi:single-strand DNA-binding protein